ncbi:MAG TPA: hypothetical protein VLT34_00455 [Arthrobacter sp.]|nr:hypothetical protein [Arthrobacter sp.]
MGFSPIGLAISVAVLAPNLLMLVFPPRDAQPLVRVPGPVSWLERAGQALCLIVPAITAPAAIVWPWLAVVLAALTGYYALWGRYLTRGRTWSLLYLPLNIVPVPMAVLPVVVFSAAAGLLGNWWIALAAAILTAGHIPASVLAARSLRGSSLGSR